MGKNHAVITPSAKQRKNLQWRKMLRLSRVNSLQACNACLQREATEGLALSPTRNVKNFRNVRSGETEQMAVAGIHLTGLRKVGHLDYLQVLLVLVKTLLRSQ